MPTSMTWVNQAIGPNRSLLGGVASLSHQENKSKPLGISVCKAARIALSEQRPKSQRQGFQCGNFPPYGR